MLRGGATRIAFLSGGKDSYYAIYKYGEVDLGLILSYEFPRPSPHLVNLGKSVETVLMCGIPVVVAKLTKGAEFGGTVNVLKRFSPSVLVAGDVYIEGHLKYMERIADEVGAKLVEPLWGRDPVDLLHEEVASGVEPLVIGSLKSIREWLGSVISRENVDLFIDTMKKSGLDPLGERGEYHTLVLSGPLHRSKLSVRVVSALEYGDYEILVTV